jgi:5-hydroxyisourate hydrolase-like protein (transthyretin family)
MSDGIDVRVLYQGKPLPDVQVEVYKKAPDGTVTVTTEHTNTDGVASVPVEPGNRYMLDSVYLRALDVVDEKDPAWESLWANLTFEVPD